MIDEKMKRINLDISSNHPRLCSDRNLSEIIKRSPVVEKQTLTFCLSANVVQSTG